MTQTLRTAIVTNWGKIPKATKNMPPLASPGRRLAIELKIVGLIKVHKDYQVANLVHI